ncbi:conserved membrane hypothetical protein [Tenacibaculum sediminilitoris]|uniref:glycosyltransferase family 2 protein n=1 Tax=Tenacibaculum sediminilitoris TaxID=1820334 RepID=UPI003896428C
MKLEIVTILSLVLYYLLLGYSLLVSVIYIALAVLSRIEIVSYFRKNSFVDYDDIPSSKLEPSISVIAPAYNESLNIVENIRSLLSLHYVDYEVIVVNDGSVDDSLEKLIKAYQLEKVTVEMNQRIQTKPIRKGIFKSKNPAFDKLVVIDKENGGKADALNMGLNFSRSEYVASIDVDCLLLKDALQKMIKPFLEQAEVKVIAAGGVIRIVNSCVIKNGKLLEVNLPKDLLGRVQVLEYLRSFLLGRMAWSKLNGLLIVSGAFGIFDKEIAVNLGGYDTNTVGEDMEIVVRMRRYMEEQNIKYKVAYIPDPLCWTEAPQSYKILMSQRNRWTRGTIETLKKHRKIGFNYNYNTLGMLSYPYWLLFERGAPIFEVLGFFYFLTAIFLGSLTWIQVIVFFVVAYLLVVVYSLLAILTEQFTYNQYKNKGDVSKLIVTAFLETIVFHPFILYAALKGNVDYYFNKNKKWGVMIRKGLSNNE